MSFALALPVRTSECLEPRRFSIVVKRSPSASPPVPIPVSKLTVTPADDPEYSAQSMPAPPSIVSAPFPPMMRSLPSSPLILSLPASPTKRLSPISPPNVSSKSVPSRFSIELRLGTESSRSPTTSFASRMVSPLLVDPSFKLTVTACERLEYLRVSLPAPPSIVSLPELPSIVSSPPEPSK